MSDFKRIATLEHLDGPRVAVTWDDAPRMIIDFGQFLRTRADFSVLKNDERLFKAVRIGDRRRTLEWPEPSDEFGDPVLDVDAETLFDIGTHQSNVDLFHRVLNFLKRIKPAN